jgi:hypothetical protein
MSYRLYNTSINPIRRGQVQILSLLFCNFSKNTKITDKNLFSAGEHRIFQIKNLK